MIVVVEGPTASGKTTWCRRLAAGVVVPETPSVEPPTDVEEAARFWAADGAGRWQRAVEIESAAGVAVCDSDPLKLHYSWSLWRIGVGSEADFRQQAAAYREAMARGRIGFADVYLVEIPDQELLQARAVGDATRRRRNFALHARLGAPLREWYSMLQRSRPGSMRWEFPEDGIESLTSGDARRIDLDTYDALTASALEAAIAAKRPLA